MTTEELEEFWDNFPACGCGEPEAVLQMVLDVLERVKLFKENDFKKDIHESLLLLIGSDGGVWLTLGVLDKLELLEHGYALPGWLTEKGEAVMTALQKFGCDPHMWRYHT